MTLTYFNPRLRNSESLTIFLSIFHVQFIKFSKCKPLFLLLHHLPYKRMYFSCFHLLYQFAFTTFFAMKTTCEYYIYFRIYDLSRNSSCKWHSVLFECIFYYYFFRMYLLILWFCFSQYAIYEQRFSILLVFAL